MRGHELGKRTCARQGRTLAAGQQVAGPWCRHPSQRPVDNLATPTLVVAAAAAWMGRMTVAVGTWKTVEGAVLLEEAVLSTAAMPSCLARNAAAMRAATRKKAAWVPAQVANAVVTVTAAGMPTAGQGWR